MSHPFNHIMPGPYRFVGVYDAETIANAIERSDSMFVKPEEGSCIGSCDHCGTAISVAVKIRGANGVFKVGESCAKKIYEQEQNLGAQIKKACNARRNQLKKAKVAQQFTECLKKLPLAINLPHPKGWEGKTLFDYLDWYRHNAGQTKFVEICNQYLPN